MQLARLLLILIVGSFAVAGCDANDGAAEKAGESLDEAGDDLRNSVEDACEEIKDGVDAEDTDC